MRQHPPYSNRDIMWVIIAVVVVIVAAYWLSR
jgi:hypothetical protein